MGFPQPEEMGWPSSWYRRGPSPASCWEHHTLLSDMHRAEREHEYRGNSDMPASHGVSGFQHMDRHTHDMY